MCSKCAIMYCTVNTLTVHDKLKNNLYRNFTKTTLHPHLFHLKSLYSWRGITSYFNYKGGSVFWWFMFMSCSHISPLKLIIDLVANSFRVMVIFTWGASYSVGSGRKSDLFKTSTSCYLKGGQCAKERRYQSSYIRQLYTELQENVMNVLKNWNNLNLPASLLFKSYLMDFSATKHPLC